MKKKVMIFLSIIILLIGICLGSYFLFFKKSGDLENSYTNYKKKNYFHIKIFELNHKEIYLALDDTKKISYTLDYDSNYEEPVTFTSNDESIAIVNEEGVITSVAVGNTTIDVKIKDEVRTVSVSVTNLINKMQDFNKRKSFLSCNKYSKEDNDLLDKALESRVKEAGEKTRGGVVAAARFIMLEFPHRISYFPENGRLDTFNRTYYVDGEGRYYHKGLYLHSSRYENLVKSMYGPKPWGCAMYSYVNEKNNRNGLDCSGFVTWVLVNGGFDPGDIGSGISDVTDLTDIGIKVKMKDAIANHSLKVGDLLSGPSEAAGGHIAILIGIHDGKYIVAEALWMETEYGVLVKEYTDKNINSYFKWQIDMTEYYGSEGNYTDYWA